MYNSPRYTKLILCAQNDNMIMETDHDKIARDKNDCLAAVYAGRFDCLAEKIIDDTNDGYEPEDYHYEDAQYIDGGYLAKDC